MSLQAIGGQLVVNDGGTLFDDDECCCEEAECPGDCTGCPDSYTAVISGLSGRCVAGIYCSSLNGTYVFTKVGASCSWNAPGGDILNVILECISDPGGDYWHLWSNVLGCFGFTRGHEGSCPPVGAYVKSDGLCSGGTCTVSVT